VPNNTAGSIIGKGGTEIAKLQASTGASVKLSQSGEFFPNSRERIVLIRKSAEVNTGPFVCC